MLLEINGEHTGSINMFDDNAVQLLKMMGQSGTTEGAIRESDVPTALNALKQALDNLAPVPEKPNDDEPSVSLKTRASPLIDLLEESIRKGGYVMWKPVS